MFDYLEGYAEDGVTVMDKRAAFNQYRLILSEASKINTTQMVLGQKVDILVILAPTALSRFFHFRGELDIAAAAESGVIYALSTLSSIPLENIGKIPGTKWFQVYVYKDRGIVVDLISCARKSGYKALCLTVDANWDGPFIIKGILNQAYAKKAVDIGAAAIFVSNYGGANLIMLQHHLMFLMKLFKRLEINVKFILIVVFTVEKIF